MREFTYSERDTTPVAHGINRGFDVMEAAKRLLMLLLLKGSERLRVSQKVLCFVICVGQAGHAFRLALYIFPRNLLTAGLLAPSCPGCLTLLLVAFIIVAPTEENGKANNQLHRRPFITRLLCGTCRGAPTVNH